MIDTPTILWENTISKYVEHTHKNQAYKADSLWKKSTRKNFRSESPGFDKGTQGLMVNALVPTGEEGRSKLRKASESCKRAKTRGYPNGVT